MSGPFDLRANTRLSTEFSTKVVAQYLAGPEAYKLAYEELMDELTDIYNDRATDSCTRPTPHPPIFVDRLASLVSAAEHKQKVFGYAAMGEFLADEGLIPPPSAPITRAPPAIGSRPLAGPAEKSKGAAVPAPMRKVVPEVVIPPRQATKSKRAQSPPPESDVEEVVPPRRTAARSEAHAEYIQDDDEEEPEPPKKRQRKVKSKASVPSDDDEYVEVVGETFKVAEKGKGKEREKEQKDERVKQEKVRGGTKGATGGTSKPTINADASVAKAPTKRAGPASRKAASTAPSVGSSASKAAAPAGNDDVEVKHIRGKPKPMTEEEVEAFEAEESDPDEPPLTKGKRAAAYKAAVLEKVDKHTFRVFDKCSLCSKQGYECTYTVGPIRKSNEAAMVTCNKCRSQKKKCEAGSGGMTLHTSLGKYKTILAPPPPVDVSLPAAGSSAEGPVPPTVGDLFTTILRELRSVNDRVSTVEQAIKELAPPGTMEYTPPIPIVADLLDKVDTLVSKFNQPPAPAPVLHPSEGPSNKEVLADILVRLQNMEVSFGRIAPPQSPFMPPPPSTAAPYVNPTASPPPDQPKRQRVFQVTAVPTGGRTAGRRPSEDIAGPTLPSENTRGGNPPSDVRTAVMGPSEQQHSHPPALQEHPAEQPDANDAPTEGTAHNATPAEGSDAPQVPAEETDIDKPPAEESDVDKAPADESDVDQAPSEGSVGDATPAEGMEPDDAPAEGRVANATPAGESDAEGSVQGSSMEKGEEERTEQTVDVEKDSSGPPSPLTPPHDDTLSEEDMDLGDQSDIANPPPASHPRNKLRSNKTRDSGNAARPAPASTAGAGFKRKAEDPPIAENGAGGASKKNRTSKKSRA